MARTNWHECVVPASESEQRYRQRATPYGPRRT